MDEIIKLTGSESAIKLEIAEILNKEESEITDNFLKFIFRYLEENSENSIEKIVIYPKFPPGVVGMMIPTVNYNINIKRGLLLSLALIIDLLGANGIATFLVAAAGIPGQILSKIEINNGELCCLNICLKENTVTDLTVYSTLSNLADCPNNQCEYNLCGKCRISLQEIKSNLNTLTIKGAMTSNNGRWCAKL